MNSTFSRLEKSIDTTWDPECLRYVVRKAMRFRLSFDVNCGQNHGVALEQTYPLIDFHSVALAVGVDLEKALNGLRELYADVDARNAQNTRDLNLPCHSGCDACCHESVFLTPLEFYGAWDWVQTNVEERRRIQMIEEGLAVYERNQQLIVQLNRLPQDGEPSHDELAGNSNFDAHCSKPMGDAVSTPCVSYWVGYSVAASTVQGGVYGCHLVGATCLESWSRFYRRKEPQSGSKIYLYA